MTARLTYPEAAYLDRLAHARDGAIQFLARYTDPLLAEFIRRCRQPVPAAYPSGHGIAQLVAGGGGTTTSTTEAAAVGQAPIDATAQRILAELDRIFTMSDLASDHTLDSIMRLLGLGLEQWEPECRNCGDKASRHPDRPGWRLILDRCEACSRYWRRNGEERPARTSVAP